MASEPAFYKDSQRFTAIALIAALSLIPEEVYGYIDPGTGSQLLQIIAAGLLTALFFIKTIWRLILSWFSKWLKPKSKSSSPDTQLQIKSASEDHKNSDSNSDD